MDFPSEKDLQKKTKSSSLFSRIDRMVSSEPELEQESKTLASSAGGGDYKGRMGYIAMLTNSIQTIADEAGRPDIGGEKVIGHGFQHRPPQWLEDKNVAIDGTPITQEELKTYSNHWVLKYRKELNIAEALQQVRQQQRFEQKHDLLGSVSKVRRFFGYSPPLDEEYAKKDVEARLRLESEARRLANQDKGEGLSSADFVSADTKSEKGDNHELGVIRTEPVEKRTLSTPWKVLLKTAETGKPLVKVANEYRPRIDFYGLDPFLNSAPSFMWFCTKCGIGVGLLQGTVKTLQAVNVDVQFLKASGVGVLSVLNMAVFASVVKWGGNAFVFSGAFCVGDRFTRFVKRQTLPSHDAETRTTANYIAGLSCAGAMVGVLPWWVLNDPMLAVRMATSGMMVGAALGIVVGYTINHLASMNVSRLDASNRQLRRYEALMLRERKWVEEQLEQVEERQPVWW